MRVFLALAAACIGLAPAARAQAAVGLRAGLNAATANPFERTSARFAPSASAFADVPVAGRLSLRPEVFFSSEGVTTESEPYIVLDLDTGGQTEMMSRTGAVQAEYAGLAALAAYTVPVGGFALSAYAGPAVSAKLRERDIFRASDFVSGSSSDVFTRASVAAVVGVTVSHGRLGLDLRTAVGLANAGGRSERVARRGFRSRVLTAALVYRPAAQRGAVRRGRPSVGVRAGVNVSAVRPGLFRDGAPRLGPAVSVFADIPVRGRLSFRPEAFYGSEGVRLRAFRETVTLDDGTTAEFVSDGGAVQAEHVGAGAFAAFTVPVAGFSVEAYTGPTASAKVREREVQRFNGGTTDESSAYFDVFAVAAVGGLTVWRGPFGLDARYAISATDAINREIIGGSRTLRSSVATVALVYRPGR